VHIRTSKNKEKALANTRASGSKNESTPLSQQTTIYEINYTSVLAALQELIICSTA
jgi:hypothetical protein